jgi:two-component system, NarL family, sensor histidine kinase DesK
MGAVHWGETNDGRDPDRARPVWRPDSTGRDPDGLADVAARGAEMIYGMNRRAAREGMGDGRRFERFWPLLYVVFLPNLSLPLTTLFHAHPSPVRAAIVLAATVLFVAIYLWTAWQSNLRRADPAVPARWPVAWRWGPVAALVTLSVILILGEGWSWLCLLIFTSAAAGGRLPLGQAIRAVVVLAVLTTVLGGLANDTTSDLGTAIFWTFMAGMLTIIMSHLRRTNHALRAAREEIARLAVEAERLRFARDLHDLLGHDLARIALQSEVAEALVPTAPDRATAAMREVGSAARAALQQVRAAVAGYRQPTLAGELRGAAEILAAAGIEYRCEGDRLTLPPAVEAVLAWVVREGVTNVVKYSRARHCLIRLALAGGEAGVEVIDDGQGEHGDRGAASPGAGGSGLAGLSERAATQGGRCEAGLCPDGGFRLWVGVPVEQRGAMGASSGHGEVAAGMATGGRT